MNCKLFILIIIATQNSLDSETNENLQGIPNLFVSKQMLENLPNPLTIRQPSVKVHRASNNNDLVKLCFF